MPTDLNALVDTEIAAPLRAEVARLTGLLSTADATVAAAAKTISDLRAEVARLTKGTPPKLFGPVVLSQQRIGICSKRSVEDVEALVKPRKFNAERVFCPPGERLKVKGKYIEGMHARGVLVVISQKDQFDTTVADARTIKAPFILARNHEPMPSDKDPKGTVSMTATEYVKQQRQLVADVAAINKDRDPAHRVYSTTLWHGWTMNASGKEPGKVRALGGLDAWLPTDMLAAMDFIGWDLYGKGVNAEGADAPGPDDRLAGVLAFVKARGLTNKPIVLGEWASPDPATYKDVCVALRAARPGAVPGLAGIIVACAWDNPGTPLEIVGDKAKMLADLMGQAGQ